MKLFLKINSLPVLIVALILGLFILAKNAVSEEVTPAEEVPSSENTSAIISNRIDFGNSYIMGQSIKSGAVYLLHRKQSEINSMLQLREEYRDEILEDFYIPEEPEAESAETADKNTKLESVK